MKLSTGTPADTHPDRIRAHRRGATEHACRLTDSHPTVKSLYARSQAGELWFRLQRHQGGLYVEREERPCRGRTCVQSVHFRNARDFERWCDDDSFRFEHPLLHIALKREAAELLQLGGRTTTEA